MNESKAIGYTRVSPRDQAANSVSLVSQRMKIEAYTTMHDLDLVKVIEDAGFSAKSLDRPGMAKLLQLIRGRKITTVVLAKLDRITRSVRDLGELIELFQRSGVEFASAADHIDTSTASGRLVLTARPPQPPRAPSLGSDHRQRVETGLNRCIAVEPLDASDALRMLGE